eukprot:COSAG02_NODE_47346_length_342_cov_0.473251_1_plen_39_part_10
MPIVPAVDKAVRRGCCGVHVRQHETHERSTRRGTENETR